MMEHTIFKKRKFGNFTKFGQRNLIFIKNHWSPVTSLFYIADDPILPEHQKLFLFHKYLKQVLTEGQEVFIDLYLLLKY